MSGGKKTTGTIYLLHLERPYRHARHYLGWTAGEDLSPRLEAHRGGSGARLMEGVAAAGIGFVLARAWEGKTRHDERRMKVRGQTRRCPVCKELKAEGKFLPDGEPSLPTERSVPQ